ncbi:hypothetical protein BpHYR1_001164 [Brachionus plicatilis]|uniref:Uncharacterized protein n=1 Tax=Brachionus plicatilis TaxID=10195 RepID=A0A3M7RKD6_BRAPC|nr:hypothetical protein BpHYR1_001164 [Brachionus plicatilis]
MSLERDRPEAQEENYYVRLEINKNHSELSLYSDHDKIRIKKIHNLRKRTFRKIGELWKGVHLTDYTQSISSLKKDY